MQDLASGKARAAADVTSDKASKASKKTQASGKEAQKSAAAKLEQVSPCAAFHVLTVHVTFCCNSEGAGSEAGLLCKVITPARGVLVQNWVHSLLELVSFAAAQLAFLSLCLAVGV